MVVYSATVLSLALGSQPSSVRCSTLRWLAHLTRCLGSTCRFSLPWCGGVVAAVRFEHTYTYFLTPVVLVSSLEGVCTLNTIIIHTQTQEDTCCSCSLWCGCMEHSFTAILIHLSPNCLSWLVTEIRVSGLAHMHHGSGICMLIDPAQLASTPSTFQRMSRLIAQYASCFRSTIRWQTNKPAQGKAKAWARRKQNT